jgi:hypothetical protein
MTSFYCAHQRELGRWTAEMDRPIASGGAGDGPSYPLWRRILDAGIFPAPHPRLKKCRHFFRTGGEEWMSATPSGSNS